jgi:hypothetical protein
LSFEPVQALWKPRDRIGVVVVEYKETFVAGAYKFAADVAVVVVDGLDQIVVTAAGFVVGCSWAWALTDDEDDFVVVEVIAVDSIVEADRAVVE